jgi:hypothetical protein
MNHLFMCLAMVCLLGGCHMTSYDTDLAQRKESDRMTWYVPKNCEEVKPYIKYVLNFKLPYTLQKCR